MECFAEMSEHMFLTGVQILKSAGCLDYFLCRVCMISSRPYGFSFKCRIWENWQKCIVCPCYSCDRLPTCPELYVLQKQIKQALQEKRHKNGWMDWLFFMKFNSQSGYCIMYFKALLSKRLINSSEIYGPNYSSSLGNNRNLGFDWLLLQLICGFIFRLIAVIVLFCKSEQFLTQVLQIPTWFYCFWSILKIKVNASGARKPVDVWRFSW